ncbi:hypothetical protein KSS87_019066 [Heliosperma pusillum]|nr:hypothetical protein KSS87_019066 [Heliosperma pusillum]
MEDIGADVSNATENVKGKGKGKEKVNETLNEDELPHEYGHLEDCWSEDSAFSDIVVGETEIEGDLIEGDELFSDYIDETLIHVVNKTLNQSCAQKKVSENVHLLNVDDVNVEVGSDDELLSDDDNRSVVGSDYEFGSNDMFDSTVDFQKPIYLKVGLRFPSVQMLRKVNLKKSRMPKCACGTKRPCEYRLYATKVTGEEFTFEIRSLNLEHSCVYTTKNSMVTSEFIAKKYLEVWRPDPGWSLIGTQSRVKLDYGVDVNYHKCWLARARAKLLIYGNSDEKYTRVWDYAHTIKKYNPGSSAFVIVGRIEIPPPVFKRMYICLRACVEGFVNGCRPLIGVDGCHLKGMCSGMILVVVAMDGNNNIFPIAWAIVEVENRDSWQWFLEVLVTDIGVDEGADFTFMSDRQKGLLDALKMVVPKSEIRFCVRHIWANFKLQFPGQAYKDSFWKAAWATTEGDYKCALE